ncbi:MAG: MarR family transcriptional regulator [Fimbriimonadaceae bacterium]|nr:MarR family transcriptional regulator [Fimbriimonadaceae bacterium]
MQSQAWRSFVTAHAVTTQFLDQQLRINNQVSLEVLNVLIALAEAPGGQIRMSDLANLIMFSRSGLTRMIDRLEEEGLVSRVPCPDDRRGWFAAITDQGRAALKTAQSVYEPALAKVWTSALSEQEATTLSQSLSKILEQVESNS